jgi:hypothetical protein
MQEAPQRRIAPADLVNLYDERATWRRFGVAAGKPDVRAATADEPDLLRGDEALEHAPPNLAVARPRVGVGERRAQANTQAGSPSALIQSRRHDPLSIPGRLAHAA